jgi:hypothetical protein
MLRKRIRCIQGRISILKESAIHVDNSIQLSLYYSFFRAEELQELVCGSIVMDFNELEQVTKYDGFESESEYMKAFWAIHEINEMKRSSYFHTAGSDRLLLEVIPNQLQSLQEMEDSKIEC